MSSPINLSTYLHYQWINGRLRTGTASLTMPTKLQLTAWNNMSDELNTRLSLGKDTLRWFFKSQWPATHQVHCYLNVSRNYPNPTCLAHQKMWHLQTKFMTHWVTHGYDHSTHILHPTLGHALVLHKKEGTNPTSPIITNWFHSYPSQQVCTTLSILLWNPI